MVTIVYSKKHNLQGKFEDIKAKGVMRSRNSKKDRQYIGQKGKQTKGQTKV
jgi:hypothetical protein